MFCFSTVEIYNISYADVSQEKLNQPSVCVPSFRLGVISSIQFLVTPKKKKKKKYLNQILLYLEQVLISLHPFPLVNLDQALDEL